MKKATNYYWRFLNKESLFNAFLSAKLKSTCTILGSKLKKLFKYFSVLYILK